jgi:SAM-dependent methyltransferase
VRLCLCRMCLCMRLRWRWKIGRVLAGLLNTQASWLEPARRFLLRDVQVARRRRVLDLGCGPGAVTPELVQRCGGTVVALDWDMAALRGGAASFQGAHRVCGDALRMPLRNESLDLVLTQCTLMWIEDATTAAAEVARVLCPGGALVALEPDYGGMMEYPPNIATRDIWIAALTRAGANPVVGRQLPVLLEASGFSVRVHFMSQLQPPAPERFDLLRTLPLTDEERRRLERIEAQDRSFGLGWKQVVHLPFFLVTAVKVE